MSRPPSRAESPAVRGRRDMAAETSVARRSSVCKKRCQAPAMALADRASLARAAAQAEQAWEGAYGATDQWCAAACFFRFLARQDRRADCCAAEVADRLWRDARAGSVYDGQVRELVVGVGG